ncbi:TetR/AcrR family transcriptional regulator [Brachybacterium fresconis]|uniref:AcrR family transcriptional regulator n=1 Tax=Brachybacterium fresconis TaxID=173363 RepID=A0ABS4YGM7_9MICO|nr:TetR/AcrR family transcriptional regulator [Brachybacterium fresconis]MBP2407956.1 AcrR family transcriptional regulator [Brachybacterium fresconis]
MAGQDHEGASRLVAMAWGLVAAPQRGPRRELSHERIVEAAIEIADAEGLAAVTMQRVARAFDFTTMALYRYVSSKDDLQRLMLDGVTGGGTWAIDDEDWRAGLEQWMRIVVGIYRSHPWSLDIPLSHETMLMPGQVRAVDAGMRAMRSLPATDDDKLAVLMLLAVNARGFASLGREMDGPEEDVVLATRGLLQEIVVDGRFPDAQAVIESGAYFGGEEPEGEGGAEDEDIGVALSLLMPGIERTFEAGSVAGEHELAPSDPARSPEGELAAAEAELAAVTALRKVTQRRARELEKREGRVRADRDRARMRAKEAAKASARRASEEDRG